MTDAAPPDPTEPNHAPPGWAWGTPGPGDALPAEPPAFDDPIEPGTPGPTAGPPSGPPVGVPSGPPADQGPTPPAAPPTIAPGAYDPPPGFVPPGYAPPGYVPPGGFAGGPSGFGQPAPGGFGAQQPGGFAAPGAPGPGADGRYSPPPPYQPPAATPAWGAPNPYGPAYGAQNENLAVASMVVGIASLVFTFFCCIGGLMGLASIPMGIVARKRIAASNGALSGSGMALAGIICGAVALGLLVLLVLFGVGLGALGSASGT